MSSGASSFVCSSSRLSFASPASASSDGAPFLHLALRLFVVVYIPARTVTRLSHATPLAGGVRCCVVATKKKNLSGSPFVGPGTWVVVVVRSSQTALSRRSGGTASNEKGGGRRPGKGKLRRHVFVIAVGLDSFGDVSVAAGESVFEVKNRPERRAHETATFSFSEKDPSCFRCLRICLRFLGGIAANYERANVGFWVAQVRALALSALIATDIVVAIRGVDCQEDVILFAVGSREPQQSRNRLRWS
mmetsp:Transcript_14371/g.43509  ORF Transcript_14371/g.43509 Transcript_14371/m.43509 type:complete len:247 (+) Transcript_14371:2406-3146(+)